VTSDKSVFIFLVSLPKPRFVFSSVAPLCRPGQRTIYGTSSSLTPAVEITCTVDANPNPSGFRWQFQPARETSAGGGLSQKRTVHLIGVEKSLSLQKRKLISHETFFQIDLPSTSFASEGDHSTLRYTPDPPSRASNAVGTAFCWAENSVGRQTSPCAFRLVRESTPERLRSCRADNVTWEVRERERGRESGRSSSDEEERYG